MQPEAPPRFVLVHRRKGPTQPGRPSVIVLHGKDRDLHATDDLESALAGDRTTIGMQAPRAQTVEETVIGYSWYLEPPGGPIEMSTLGDALAQLEQGLFRVVDDGDGTPVAIVGEGQGGTVALLLASIWPELVTRAVAIGGSFPHLPPEIDVPSPTMTTVRAMLVSGDSRGGRVDDATAARLRDRGASVEAVDLGQSGASRATWVCAWLSRTDA